MYVTAIVPDEGEEMPDLLDLVREDSEDWMLITLSRSKVQYLMHFTDHEIYVKDLDSGSIELVELSEIRKHEKALFRVFQFNADQVRKINRHLRNNKK